MAAGAAIALSYESRHASVADVIIAKLGGAIAETCLAHEAEQRLRPLLSANALLDVGRRSSRAHVASA
jgi:hypothetical protein